MRGDLIITRSTSSNADFRELVRLLDLDLAIRNGEENAFFAAYNKLDHIDNVVMAYREQESVGCGAFKRFAQTIVEIKRMYVRPECRGRGIAAAVLAELEKWAGELGFSEAVLETGRKMPEAVRLYQKSGYVQIPNYGQYVGVESSVCMKKELRDTARVL